MWLALAVLLLAWFVETPLWVSIVVTVLAVITGIIKLVNTGLDILKDDLSDDDDEKH